MEDGQEVSRCWRHQGFGASRQPPVVSSPLPWQQPQFAFARLPLYFAAALASDPEEASRSIDYPKPCLA